jgi:SET domain-containing protein
MVEKALRFDLESYIKSNVTMAVNPADNSILAMAIKDIKKNEELTFSYGAAYWFNYNYTKTKYENIDLASQMYIMFADCTKDMKGFTDSIRPYINDRNMYDLLAKKMLYYKFQHDKKYLSIIKHDSGYELKCDNPAEFKWSCGRCQKNA